MVRHEQQLTAKKLPGKTPTLRVEVNRPRTQPENRYKYCEDGWCLTLTLTQHEHRCKYYEDGWWIWWIDGGWMVDMVDRWWMDGGWMDINIYMDATIGK